MPRASIVTVSAPEFEPLTLTETKRHLRVEHDADDDLINALITAAREHAETHLRRPIMPQTLRMGLDQFPWDGVIEIPRGNVRWIVSITYVDPDGDTQTIAEADYYLDAELEPARVVPALDAAWQATAALPGAVKVTFRAGYAPVGSPDDESAQQAGVPRAIRVGLLLHIGHLYENREAGVIGVTASEVPFGYDALMHPYRLLG